MHLVIKVTRAVFQLLRIPPSQMTPKKIGEVSTVLSVRATASAQRTSAPLNPKLTFKQKVAALDDRSLADHAALKNIEVEKNRLAIGALHRRLTDATEQATDDLNRQIATVALSGVRVTTLGLALATFGTVVSYRD